MPIGFDSPVRLRSITAVEEVTNETDSPRGSIKRVERSLRFDSPARVPLTKRDGGWLTAARLTRSRAELLVLLGLCGTRNR